MPSPKVVLFDLGGVLLPFDRERRVAALARFAGTERDTARALLASGPIPGLFRRLDLGEAHLADFAGAFAGFAAAPVTETEAKALILSVFEPPSAPAWALAARLSSRYRIGGFSDNPSFVRELFPAGARLDPMLFSSELGALKPTEAAFAAVAARLAARPAEILFIDDTEANILQAHAMGWQAIHFVSALQLEADLAVRGLI